MQASFERLKDSGEHAATPPPAGDPHPEFPAADTAPDHL